MMAFVGRTMQASPAKQRAEPYPLSNGRRRSAKLSLPPGLDQTKRTLVWSRATSTMLPRSGLSRASLRMSARSHRH